MLAGFGDKALRPGYELRMSDDFHDRAEIHADFTNAYMNVRLAANVEAGTEATKSPETREKLHPQRCQPAQKPRIDWGKTSKATSAKVLGAQLRSPRSGPSGGSF